MESLPAFKFRFWNAVRLGLAVRCNHPSQTFRRFSVRGEELMLENGSPGRAGPKAVSHLHADPLPDRAESGEAAQPNQQPLPAHKACRDRRLQTPFHRRWKLPAHSPPAREEEFWNLRNDDFKEKRQPRPRPLPVGRTEGSEILFGIAPCSLALARSKRDFFRLFLKSGSASTRPVMEEFSQQAEARGIPVRLVPRKVLDALCMGGVHQGVCLEATPLRPISWQEGSSHEAEGAAARERSQLLWLALEGIQDPMNLGAVLRSAHFLGVDGIVMSQRNSCPLTPVVSKASAGAMEVLDVFGTDRLQSFLQAKSEQGWEIVGTVGHSTALDDIPTESCLDFRWTKPTVLLLGNEGYGLSPETRRLCRRMLSIFPGRELQPGIESLNVSVAAGILLHSICSQKMKAT